MERTVLETDLLIVGAGFAGCRAAIEAHDLGANVLLVTQGHFVATGSSFHPIRLTWGRGYTAGLGINGQADTPDAHLADILRAGQGLTDEHLARVLVEDAPVRYRDLETFGVEFTLMSRLMKLDVNDHGRGTRGALAMNPENLRATFRQQIESRNISVREQTQVVALIGEPGYCAGAILVDNGGAITVVHTRAVILAAGGPNDLFLHNLNTPDLTGACHVFAFDLGARLINLEFFQIILGMAQHPHATFAEAFLGLHPKIRTSAGDEMFADAPDILDARAKTGPFTWNNPAAQFDLALQNELRAGRTVAADFSGIAPLEVSQTIANQWRVWAETHGVNFSRPIEIAPCAHACNGGILIDADGGTGVANLFACGEIAGGMHGANRIGGNQFASAQVFGVRAARAAVRCARESTSRELNRGQIAEHVTRIEQLHARGDQGVPALELRRQLQDAMWRDAMLDRTEASLQNAQTKLREIESRLSRVAFHSPGEFAIALGLPGMIRIAQIILRVALQRNESRGPHYRADFAFQDEENFRKPIVVSQNESWTRMNAENADFYFFRVHPRPNKYHGVLQMNRAPVLAIDIGGTKIAGAIAFPDGRIAHHQTRPTLGVEGGEAIMRRVIELAQTIVASSESKPSAIGVSTGGDVRLAGEIVYATATIPGWQGMPVRARLEANLGLRAFVDNDGNAMALGEALFGAGRGHAHVIGVVVGTGIGGGIVLDQKIYRGAHGFAGRLGHIIVDFTDQQPCTCGGAGCLEAHAASLALIADFKNRTRTESLGPGFGVKEIAQLAANGNQIAIQVIERGAYFLGVGIASFLNLFDPDVVIVGGGVAQIGETYLAAARRVARERAQASVRDTPIVSAQLGTHANLIGAAEMAWQGLEA